MRNEEIKKPVRKKLYESTLGGGKQRAWKIGQVKYNYVVSEGFHDVKEVPKSDEPISFIERGPLYLFSAVVSLPDLREP